MRFCEQHWAKLRAAIEARGLSALVAKSGEEAARRMGAELDAGEPTKTSFDPLMAAHNAIVGNALDRGGLELMTVKDDGSEHCPLCFMNERHAAQCTVKDCATSADTWIDCAANDALADAKQLGLVGTA